MKRIYFSMLLVLISVFCYAQQNAGIRVIGRIPDAVDNRLYQLQVGAFKVVRNAEGAFEKLKAASMKPSYEKYGDLTRVIIKGVRARDIPSYIEKIRKAGFSDVFIKLDASNATAGSQPSAMTQTLSMTQPLKKNQPPAPIQPPAITRPPVIAQPPAAPQPPAIPQSSAATQPPEIPQSSVADQPPATIQPPASQQSMAAVPSPEAPEEIWAQDDENEDEQINEDGFPKTGSWKITGYDSVGTEWKADLVISKIKGSTFDGYFNWYMGPDFEDSGKEYFTGRFDNTTDKVYFEGTNNKYQAYVTINRDGFYNGIWEDPDDILNSYWQSVVDE